MCDTVCSQTLEGVSHPPNIPVDRKVVFIEAVLHVMEELSLRLHKSHSRKTMPWGQFSHPSEAFPMLVICCERIGFLIWYCIQCEESCCLQVSFVFNTQKTQLNKSSILLSDTFTFTVNYKYYIIVSYKTVMLLLCMITASTLYSELCRNKFNILKKNLLKTNRCIIVTFYELLQTHYYLCVSHTDVHIQDTHTQGHETWVQQ